MGRRRKLELRVYREYEVVSVDSKVSHVDERVMLRGRRGLDTGDELMLPEQPGVRFRVSGLYFSNPPQIGLHPCLLKRTSGDEELREGMILVLVEQS